jgi:hypothetical protein
MSDPGMAGLFIHSVGWSRNGRYSPNHRDDRYMRALRLPAPILSCRHTKRPSHPKIANLRFVPLAGCIQLRIRRLGSSYGSDKARQITAMFTSLTAGDSSPEMSEVGVSSQMDAWLPLRNPESNGERNRGLYVLKSRGMAHSNQIREFVLTDHGVQLVDVYIGTSGLLTGSARVAQEAKERAEAEERKQRHLPLPSFGEGCGHPRGTDLDQTVPPPGTALDR